MGWSARTTSPTTGAFILIDPESNATVAAGMVVSALGQDASGESGPVTAGERAARWGHRGGVLQLSGPAEAIDRIERSLFAHGVITARIEAGDQTLRADAELFDLLVKSTARSGFVALAITSTDGDILTARVENEQVTLNAYDSDEAIKRVHELLERAGILAPRGNADWEI